MKIQSGGREFTLCFMTATWGGDLGHFRWLRRSLEKTGFADVPHIVVVQTEDLEQFRPLASGGVQLRSTAEMLPGDVERRRVDARRRADRYGRRVSRLCASLNKRTGLCGWVRYSGWHVQQVTKLSTAATSSDYELTVVLDSDLLFTRSFDLRLFVPDGHPVVFEHPEPAPGRWHAQAYRLLKLPWPGNGAFNSYVGTPFVFHRPTLAGLLAWLESEHREPWYEVLLAEPSGAWSEFCIYTAYARKCANELSFAANPHSRDLYGADLTGDRDEVERIARGVFADPQVYFTNIPTQRLARGRWDIAAFEDLLRGIYGCSDA